VNTCFFDEPEFNKMLNLERKRSQRSMNLLILMRLDISGLMGPNPADVFRKLQTAVATGIRDTDVCGWCKHGSIAGILFTDVESASPAVREILFRRVMARLARQIDPEVLFKIKVTFRIYLEGRAHSDAVDRFDMEDHKDLVNEIVKFNLSAKIKFLVDRAGNLLMS
jgi:hypothetical protein